MGENKYGFTEVLKHVNDMAHRIDLEKCLSKAEGLAVALQKDENLPEKVANILGLGPPSSQTQAAPTRGSVLRERHGTEGSNVSGASLEHSSSVECFRFCPRWRTRQSLNLTPTLVSSDNRPFSTGSVIYTCCTNIQSN